jgi:Protein of unknown function (DUF1236)
MKTLHLLSTAAVVVLLGGGIAVAQDMKKDAAPAPAPTAQQNAPAEKVGPSLKAGKEKAQENNTKAASEPKATPKAETTGQVEPKPMNSDHTQKEPDHAQPDHKSAEGANAVTPKTNEAAAPLNRATTGQGAAAGAAKLSTEQRTKISTAFRAHKVPSVHLSVSVSVGAQVPESVHFYPIPVEVIDLYPEWRGYDYIYVGDEIVIVDPRTHEIVAVLEA